MNGKLEKKLSVGLGLRICSPHRYYHREGIKGRLTTGNEDRIRVERTGLGSVEGPLPGGGDGQRLGRGWKRDSCRAKGASKVRNYT